MDKLLKVIFGATLASGFLLGLVGKLQAEEVCPKDPIKFAGITWETGEFYTELARILIEKGYGCKTEVVTGSSAVTQAALSVGDVQVWMEYWEGRAAPIQAAEKAGKVVVTGEVLAGGTLEGWFVPDFVVHGDAAKGWPARAPELSSVSDLPKYKQLFADPESSGKGRFYNCPIGWDCEKVNSRKLIAYDLLSSYNNFQPGTGGALDAAIVSAFQRGEPILVYYWEPSALFGKYKFYRLKEPTYNDKCWQKIYNSTTPKPCGSATPTTKLRVVVYKSLANNTALMNLFQKIKLTTPVLDQAILDISEKKMDPHAVAEAYLKANSDVWASWLPTPVVAKIRAGLQQ